MLRKRGSGGGELPTTLGQASKVPDGSGKSIKMEAPLAKAIRSADGFIKGTYIWLFISLIFIWGGWSWIRRNSASIVMDCNAAGCTLTIQTPYSFLPRDSSTGIPTKTKSRRKRKTTIEIKKDQLVRADNVKWDPTSQVIVENYGLQSPTYQSQRKTEEEEEEGDDTKRSKSNKPYNKQNKKHKYKNYNAGMNRSGGPDKDGYYDSYVIVFRDPLPPPFEEGEEADPDESPSMRMARRMAQQHAHMKNDPNSLATVLAPFAIPTTNTEYILHPRDFNLGQTRRLARTAVSKIVAYTLGRRASCILRESRPVAWQGLVLLILGIFSLVLCLLLGQFWETYDPTKVGSYRKRMAEIRRREELKKSRLKKNFKRPPLRRPTERNVGRSGGSALKKPSAGTSVPSKPATGSTRSRPNAGASSAKDSWMGSAGSVPHAYTKRGY